jgi:hypothetical protein
MHKAGESIAGFFCGLEHAAFRFDADNHLTGGAIAGFMPGRQEILASRLATTIWEAVLEKSAPLS